MKVGIVGSEAKKFIKETEAAAKGIIREILTQPNVTAVVSGRCHLGGIDIWAAEIGHELGLQVIEFPARCYNWSMGYRPRNIQIAEESDIIYCITLKKLPEHYAGMRFPRCYHCPPPPASPEHVKSGGCWTMRYAASLGVPEHLIVIE